MPANRYNESIILPPWQYEKEFPNIPIVNNDKIWVDSVYQEPYFHFKENAKVKEIKLMLGQKLRR